MIPPFAGIWRNRSPRIMRLFVTENRIVRNSFIRWKPLDVSTTSSRYRKWATCTSARWDTFSSLVTHKTGSPDDFLNSLSHREKALLEQHLFDAFRCSSPLPLEQPIDPILHKEIGSLGWVQSIRIEKNRGDGSTSLPQLDGKKPEHHSYSIQVILKLPTLHPSMDTLKTRISSFLAYLFMEYARKQGWNIMPPDHHNESGPNILAAITYRIQFKKQLPYFIQQLEKSNPVNSKERLKNLGPGLQHVLHYVAVYSCKGGVGKSTIAVNLAFELARSGARVGLADVDIYGPSLPVLVKVDDQVVRRSPLGSAMILPLQHKGVKMISLGFVSPNSGVPGSGPSGGAAVMRGPMASRVVTQLLKGTDWGDLDVLILDLPPGTGDVQLTVCQEVQLSGVVSVLTPSALAWTDALKGLEMFSSMGIKTICAVENMAFFTSSDGVRHYPFGKGDAEIASKFGLDDSHVFHVPVSSHINESNDSGVPLCLKRSEQASSELDVFERIGNCVSKELFLLHGSPPKSSLVTFLDKPNVVFDLSSFQLSVDNHAEGFIVRFYSDQGAYEARIPGNSLYSIPMDGMNNEKDLTPKPSQNTGAFPCQAERKGDGYVIKWASGSRSTYSNYFLAKAAGATVTSVEN